MYCVLIKLENRSGFSLLAYVIVWYCTTYSIFGTALLIYCGY